MLKSTAGRCFVCLGFVLLLHTDTPIIYTFDHFRWNTDLPLVYTFNPKQQRMIWQNETEIRYSQHSEQARKRDYLKNTEEERIQWNSIQFSSVELNSGQLSSWNSEVVASSRAIESENERSQFASGILERGLSQKLRWTSDSEIRKS